MTEQQDGFSADDVGGTENEQRLGGCETKHRPVLCHYHERLRKHTTSTN